MKYFRNTSWLFGEKILRMIVGLFVGIWVARYLGPEQFGLFSYAQSFVGLFMAIATLGLDGIVVRELIKNETRRDTIIGTAFGLKLMGAIAVLLVLAITVNFTSNDHYTNLLVLIIASATVFQSFNVVDMYFQSKVLSRYIVFANIISLFISSLVKITLIFYEAPLIAFAWTVLFDSIILAMGFMYFYLNNHLSFKNWRFDRNIALELLNTSWPYILSGIVVSLLMRTDQVMLKYFENNAIVGYYAAATRISEAWYFIPTVIASSLFPAIVNAKQQSSILYMKRLQMLTTLMIWTAIIVALGITFLSDQIINILYGQEYYPAGVILVIHVWIGVMVSFGLVNGQWILMENLQKYALFQGILQVLLNIVLNYFFIQKLGGKGAALATLLTSILSMIVMSIFFRKFRITLLIFTKSFLFPYTYLKEKYQL